MGCYSLKDRHVLITGASSGIGKELSRCFAEEGAHCVLAALPSEEETLLEWVAEIRERFGVKAWPVLVDLAEDDGPERVSESVGRLVPHLDVLVNNAGVLTYGSFHEVSLARSDNLVLVNVRAYMCLMRLFLPDMISRGEGRILNVSSAAALRATAHIAVYGATKAFVQSLSEAVRQEVKGSGVVVCTLNPNFTATSMLRGHDFPEKLWAYLIAGVSDPATIARKGVNALKRGKSLYMPGLRNRLLMGVGPRILPRRTGAFILYHLLKARKS